VLLNEDEKSNLVKEFCKGKDVVVEGAVQKRYEKECW